MAEVGTYREAEDYASKALDLYTLNAPRLPVLAHDFGFLLVKSGCFTPAVSLLQLTVSRIPIPELQTLAWATLARAAAGAGRWELYGDAEKTALARVGLHQEYAPGVFINLSEGARTLGEWDQAESYAAMGLHAAKQRQQAFGERVALALLDQIAARQAAPLEETPPDSDSVRMLTRRFMARLRKWKAPDSGEPGAGENGGNEGAILEF